MKKIMCWIGLHLFLVKKRYSHITNKYEVKHKKCMWCGEERRE